MQGYSHQRNKNGFVTVLVSHLTLTSLFQNMNMCKIEKKANDQTGKLQAIQRVFRQVRCKFYFLLQTQCYYLYKFRHQLYRMPEWKIWMELQIHMSPWVLRTIM